MLSLPDPFWLFLEAWRSEVLWGWPPDRRTYHCYSGDPPQCAQADTEECHCSVLSPSSKTSSRKQGFYPQSDISPPSKANLNFANINWYVLSLTMEYIAQLSHILIYTNNSQWRSFPGGRNNQFNLNWDEVGPTENFIFTFSDFWLFGILGCQNNNAAPKTVYKKWP